MDLSWAGRFIASGLCLENVFTLGMPGAAEAYSARVRQREASQGIGSFLEGFTLSGEFALALSLSPAGRG